MNTFGRIFRLSSFGESHGRGIGGVIDGCPPGLSVDLDLIRTELGRRRPGQTALSTARNEADDVELISGIFEGKTTGAPIGFLVRNTDMRSQDYDYLKGIFRPSHADYTYHSKYGIRDHRGGGRSSARETIARVVAGAFAKMLLNSLNISIEAFTTQIGPIALQQEITQFSSELAAENPLHCPDQEKAQAMMALIAQTKEEQDSIGGVVSCIIKGVPVGWGEPVFGKLHAGLGAAILSIPACKGFEYGSGFDVSQKGSQQNDAFYFDSKSISTRSNHSGGIQGGISNGQSIYFKAAFKPIASIRIPQETVDKEGVAVQIQIEGRHDPCALPRALPVVEAMAAMVLADACLLAKSNERVF
jgi:chorismate synthase